jgi:hypothetical protein
MNVGHSAHGDVAQRSLVHAGEHLTAGFGWPQMVPVRGVLWLPEKFGEFQMRGRRRELNIALDLLRGAEACGNCPTPRHGTGSAWSVTPRTSRLISCPTTSHVPMPPAGPPSRCWRCPPRPARVLAGVTAGMLLPSARARPPRRVPPGGCSSWLTTCIAPIRRRSGDWTACSGALSRRRRCGSWPAAR